MVSRDPQGSLKLVVSGEYATVEPIDVLQIVQEMKLCLQSCYRWLPSGRLGTAKPKLVLESSLAIDHYELPSIVGQPAAASAEYLRPASSTNLMFENATTQSVIRELVYRKAFAGKGIVDMAELHEFNASEISKMVSCGILTSQRSMFGEPAVALNVDMVQWSVLVLLSEPCQHLRLQSPHKDMQRSKLDILMQLRAHGWREVDDQDLEVWEPGRPLSYIAGMRQPLSYFVCLLRREDIISKGVKAIGHRQLDGYYKCLLAMPAGPGLDKMLADMNQKPNAWFLSNIKGEDAAAAAIDDEVEPRPGQAALEDVAEYAEADDTSAACSLLFHQVKSSTFSRQLVDMGPQTHQAKVYFDHFSGSGPESSKQRYFIACDEHCCIRYRPVHETDSLLDVCCKAYLWHIKATDFPDKHSHLGFDPGDDEVAELRNRIRLIPF